MAAPAAATYVFAFRDAEIGQVAEEILGRTLGLSYTIDPAVTGKMSFRIDQRMTPAQLLAAFETALGGSNIVMVRQGESLLLVPREKAAASSAPRATGEAPPKAGYSVVTMPLSFAIPSEVARLLSAMGPANVVLSSDDKAGVIVLGGTPREIEAAQASIRAFDRSGMEGARMRWFDLTQAPAVVVAGELNQVLKASDMAGASVTPLRRLNGLIGVARTPEALDEIGRWVIKLDQPSRDVADTLWVYHPKNVSAESLSRALASVLGDSAAVAPGGGSAASTAPGVAPSPAASSVASASSMSVTSGPGDAEASVRIGVDVESNSLLISAPMSRRIQIQKVLDEIDVTPTQVMVEATILEVTLDDEFRLGVNWSVLADAGKLKIVSSGDSAGSVAPTYPGFAVTFIDNDVKAAIDALGSRTNVQVVSAPKIVVVNNRTATLQIGDQVPVANQSSQAVTTPDAPRIVTIEYRDTGVILNVTPRVSGDSILLNVSQEVSAVAKTTTSGIDSPTIRQRKMESTLLLNDGGLVALGGLISTTTSGGDTGVPGLKKAPIVGFLFKTQDKETHRTELIVLLTAKVMRGPEDSSRAIADLLEDMKEIQSRGLLKR